MTMIRAQAAAPRRRVRKAHACVAFGVLFLLALLVWSAIGSAVGLGSAGLSQLGSKAWSRLL